MNAPMKDNSPMVEIRPLLERFDVRYDVFPESAVGRDHAIRPVGYVVNLYGDDASGQPLRPGDERSREVLRGLYRVAAWAVEGDHRACHIEIHGTDMSLHYLKSGNDHGRVQVEIRVLHDAGIDRPLDSDVKRALENLIARLESVGVGPRLSAG